MRREPSALWPVRDLTEAGRERSLTRQGLASMDAIQCATVWRQMRASEVSGLWCEWWTRVGGGVRGRLTGKEIPVRQGWWGWGHPGSDGREVLRNWPWGQAGGGTVGRGECPAQPGAGSVCQNYVTCSFRPSASCEL